MERATRFWGQLYLVNYALGIVAGILLELQFGLHFPGLLDVAGEVFGAPLAVETMVAFFLESTLLGLWIFGWHQLNRGVHTVVFWLVVLTGYASAFAVMVANGFLRHPVGYELSDGVAHITDTAALVLNPAAVLSLGHIVGACLLAGAFVVIGVSAWHLRRQTGHDELFQRSLRTGVVVGGVGALLAVGFGFSQFGYLGGDEAREPGRRHRARLHDPRWVRAVPRRVPDARAHAGRDVVPAPARAPGRGLPLPHARHPRAVRDRDPRLAGARDRASAVGRRRRAEDLRRRVRPPADDRAGLAERARRADRGAGGRGLGRPGEAGPPRPAGADPRRAAVAAARDELLEFAEASR